jgi:spore maturation protein CgeB
MPGFAYSVELRSLGLTPPLLTAKLSARMLSSPKPIDATAQPAGSAARVVIVGNASLEHFGAHLLAAAPAAGVDATLIDVKQAWSQNKWLDRINFHLRHRRPTWLGRYSERVVEHCRQARPELLLATGIAPLTASALAEIGRLGIARANLLTDDPWNKTKEAGFFWPALLQYDTIFTCRHSHIPDLRGYGCRDVQFLWLSYNPALHFREEPADEHERARYACDLAFVGGGDETRRALVLELLRAGVDLKLYGGYWDRFPDTSAHYHGFVIGRELRLAVAGGLANLCMGRAANRDGHAMRTFELPAMGACMIVEDTAEHRELFGPEGDCVFYYRSAADIVGHVQVLRADPARARRAAQAVEARITSGDNTYAARLRTVVERMLGDRRSSRIRQ